MATLTSAIAPPVSSVPPVPGLPLVGNLIAFRRDRLALQDRAARIGPIARLMIAHVPIYIVTDADLAHEVLVVQADAFKKSAGLQLLKPMLGEGLLTAEGDTHKRHRKLLAPAFAPKRLEKYGTIMVEETAKQLARWRHGQRLDLANEMMEMTLAIAGRTMFGADVRSDAAMVAEALELGMRAQVASLRSPLPLGYEWPLPRHLQMRRAVKMLDAVVYRLIREGRARGTDRGDVLSILLLARDEAGGLTDSQVRDEVMTLLLAGHETTANALTWTWFELARHPDVRAKLADEVDALGDRPVTVDDLARLPFNLAVIEEAMRLHPPAYMTGREATQDIELGGHRLPKGAIVAINIRGIHRRADYFPGPDAFLPERMLPDAKKARARHHYLPFGAGPRVCIGSHFALLEAQLALATMVQRARVRLLASHVAPEPLVTLRPRGGMPVVAELRS
ncbi:MAG TPA: cytochrome P450 [Kofleriaceae bacterium]|nr:cytochrome P450 [Kofleriaceae bacterium]